jgi:hypothetical protein
MLCVPHVPCISNMCWTKFYTSSRIAAAKYVCSYHNSFTGTKVCALLGLQVQKYLKFCSGAHVVLATCSLYPRLSARSVRRNSTRVRELQQLNIYVGIIRALLVQMHVRCLVYKYKSTLSPSAFVLLLSLLTPLPLPLLCCSAIAFLRHGLQLSMA